jgi:hypothetical protein
MKFNWAPKGVFSFFNKKSLLLPEQPPLFYPAQSHAFKW